MTFLTKANSHILLILVCLLPTIIGCSQSAISNDFISSVDVVRDLTTSASAPSTLNLNESAQLAGSISDADASCEWTKVDGPGTITFSDAKSLTSTATFSLAGNYKVRFSCSLDKLSKSSDVDLIVSDAGLTISAGTDQTVAFGSNATLAGTRSSTDLGCTWQKQSGPGTVTFSDSSSLNSTASFSAVGDYQLSLTCQYGLLTRTDTVKVSSESGSYSASAGPDQTLVFGVQAQLAGTRSSTNLACGWSKVSGPGTVTFSNTSDLAATSTFSDPGVYTLRNTCTFGPITKTDDVVVTVDSSSYSASAGSDQTVVFGNQVQLAGTRSNTNLSCAWSKVSGPGTVTFSNASDLASTATFSAAGVYSLRNACTFGPISKSDDVTITMDASGFSAGAGPDQTVVFGAAATLAGTKSNANLSCSWSKLSGPGAVTFGDANSLTSTATFAAEGVYALRNTCTYQGETRTDDVQITTDSSSYTISAGADQALTYGNAATLAGTKSSANLGCTWSKLSGPGTLNFADATSLTSTVTPSQSGTYVARLSCNYVTVSRADDVQLDWTNIHTVEFTNIQAGGGDTLTLSNSDTTATRTAGSGWDTGASSKQSIGGGTGYIEFSPSATNRALAVGLSNGDPGGTLNEIDFAFYLVNNGQLRIYENGTNRGTFANPFNVTDTLKIEVAASGRVLYYINGALVRVSTATVTYPLLVDTAFNTNGGSVTNIKMSADNKVTSVP